MLEMLNVVLEVICKQINIKHTHFLLQGLQKNTTYIPFGSANVIYVFSFLMTILVTSPPPHFFLFVKNSLSADSLWISFSPLTTMVSVAVTCGGTTDFVVGAADTNCTSTSRPSIL